VTARGSQEEIDNNFLVHKLYDAIAEEDVPTVQSCLSPELDWWYHGPPGQQHMKFLLTGFTKCGSYPFSPIEIWVIGNRVFVEGRGAAVNSSWVHVWGARNHVFVVLREYFNTALMVTDVSPSVSSDGEIQHHDVGDWLWQSTLARERDDNIPGIVLAIDNPLNRQEP
jgi:hypothetical protein